MLIIGHPPRRWCLGGSRMNFFKKYIYHGCSKKEKDELV
jgi:hypothetical protein